MTTTIQGISLKDKLLAEFELQRNTLLLENPMLQRFRESAASAFDQKGFPGKKQEDYKYLNFSSLLHEQLSVPFSFPEMDIERNEELISDNDIVIHLVNGMYSADHSRISNLPGGCIIGSLGEAIRRNDKHVLSVLGTLAKSSDDPFVALNSALFMDGLFVYLPKHTSLNQPIHIIQSVQGDEAVFAQARILVVAESGSKARVMHHMQSKNNASCVHVSNTVIELDIEEGALVEWVSVQEESDKNGHVCLTQAHVHTAANYRHISIALDGQLIRNNLQVVLEDSHCESHLYGYYHPRGKSSIDNHTLVDHRMPNCNSNELYKGVIDESGTATFNGKIFVQQDAQKTIAFQSNKNILLTETGTVNTKPQLEIYADDVKCSHGSSTGVLDPEQVFYLRSRGLRLEKARALLLGAYAGEILEQIEDPILREKLLLKIEQRIQA